jgi:predicted phage-related endonuclease
MGTNEITTKVHELRELYRMADELENMINSIHAEIRGHMDAAGLDYIAGSDYKINYKPVTRSRIDTTAFKRENPELAARYTVTKTIRPFCVV